MNIKFKLNYVGYNIFNIERYDRNGFIPERSGVFSRETGKSRMSYADGINLDVLKIFAEDEFVQLVISIYLDGDTSHHVVLETNAEFPVIVTFRVYPSYCEDMSIDGGVTEELRATDKYYFQWQDNTYI